MNWVGVSKPPPFIFMEFNSQDRDALGKVIGDKYCLILTDLNFERKLKAFDPCLKLAFNKIDKRWCILERRERQTRWNILFKCEDREGNAKPVGDWVLNKLFVMRNNHHEFLRKGDQFWDDMDARNEMVRETARIKSHHNGRLKLIDDVNLYRKAYREMNNMPTSDVTAGYPKKGHKYAT